MAMPTTISQRSLFRPLRPGLFVACLTLFTLAALRANLEPGSKEDRPGVLILTIVDEVTGKPTPARVEVLDQKGKGYIAEDALPVWTYYWTVPEGFKDPMADALKRSVKKVSFSGDADQFYCGGKARVSLPGGTYSVRAFKGNEYRIASREIPVRAGETIEATVTLKRWANGPKEGWYSADTHLHIGRPDKEFNPIVAKWMQAEDIHVAGLLQWGDTRQFRGSPQYAFGNDGVYRDGDYLLVSGQENPRSFLGHAVILGGRSPINFPDKYLIYKQFWEEARRQDAIAGACHGGMSGLAIDVPDGLLSLIEVLQFGGSNYAAWYAVLNSGFRMTPIAGTDAPATRIFPGRERTYAHIEGQLSHDGWLKAIRQGKTYVTNGPLLEFRVNGQEIGSEITLKEPTRVTIEGRVRFDAEREDVQRVEIVENGDVIRAIVREKDAAEIVFRFTHAVAEAGWLAVRASGIKREKRSPSPKEKVPQALAHSGVIYLAIENQPGQTASRRAKLAARNWLAQLDALEKRVTDDAALKQLGGEGADLKKTREEFLQQIQAARKFFLARSQ
jgi:hypothetical protein